MDATSYCNKMGRELTAWKARLYDALRKAQQLPDTQKGPVDPMIAQLNTLVDEIDADLAQLQRECPAEWNDVQTAVDDRFRQMKTRWKEVWGALGEPDYGIGGA
jgi:hypothetical protein